MFVQQETPSQREKISQQEKVSRQEKVYRGVKVSQKKNVFSARRSFSARFFFFHFFLTITNLHISNSKYYENDTKCKFKLTRDHKICT